MHDDDAAGFVPPPYPYDRLDALQAARRRGARRRRRLLDRHAVRPVPEVAVARGSPTRSPASTGYPPSIGSAALREAAARVDRAPVRRRGRRRDEVVACVGTKEFVASLPHLLRLRDPSRDTVLYPAVAYPTYEMGAILAGCRAVPVPLDADWHLDLDAIADADAERALCSGSTSPATPPASVARRATQIAAIVGVGPRARASSSRATSATPSSPRRRARRPILHRRRSTACSRVHSLSKRSNMAGLRVGFVAGDPELVDVPRSRPASTPGSWCPRRCRPRPRPRSATTRTSPSSARATPSAASSCVDALARARARARRRAVAVLPLAARRRAAPTTAGRSRRRLADAGHARRARRPLRRRRRRPRAARARAADRATRSSRSTASTSPRPRATTLTEGPRVDDLDEADHRSSGKRRDDLARRDAARPRRTSSCTRSIDLLDRGEVRVAEVVDGDVVVHEWLKHAILLCSASRHGDRSSSGRSSTSTSSRSSTTTRRPGVRVVPGRVGPLGARTSRPAS